MLLAVINLILNKQFIFWIFFLSSGLEMLQGGIIDKKDRTLTYLASRGNLKSFIVPGFLLVLPLFLHHATEQ